MNLLLILVGGVVGLLVLVVAFLLSRINGRAEQAFIVTGARVGRSPTRRAGHHLSGQKWSWRGVFVLPFVSASSRSTCRADRWRAVGSAVGQRHPLLAQGRHREGGRHRGRCGPPPSGSSANRARSIASPPSARRLAASSWSSPSGDHPRPRSVRRRSPRRPGSPHQGLVLDTFQLRTSGRGTLSRPRPPRAARREGGQRRSGTRVEQARLAPKRVAEAHQGRDRRREAGAGNRTEGQGRPCGFRRPAAGGRSRRCEASSTPRCVVRPTPSATRSSRKPRPARPRRSVTPRRRRLAAKRWPRP